MEYDLELLISAIQDRPAIWDKSADIYKDRFATGKAWREVLNIVNPEFENMPRSDQKKYEKEILTKWKSVRDGYRRSVDRMKNAKKSGAPASKIKKYIYNDQLEFMRKIYQNRMTDDACVSESSECGNRQGGDDSEGDDRGNLSGIELEDSDTSHQPSTSTQRACTRKKNKETMDPDEYQERILNIEQKPNRHITFMQSLLPSLENFDDDDVIDFQIGVLNLIKRIKNSKNPFHQASTMFPDPSHQISVNTPPIQHHDFGSHNTNAPHFSEPTSFNSSHHPMEPNKIYFIPKRETSTSPSLPPTSPTPTD